ncbi:hypothetical protein LB519_06245 [Mesorhizobium sp. AD1-1]|nr:hypothetical protein [Mesorhizobium sp. AD1-1]
MAAHPATADDISRLQKQINGQLHARQVTSAAPGGGDLMFGVCRRQASGKPVSRLAMAVTAPFMRS